MYFQYFREDAEAHQTPIPFNFHAVDGALATCGLKYGQRMTLYQTLAGILLFGNVKFENSADGCLMNDTSEQTLSNAANLFGMQANLLKSYVTSRQVCGDK